MASIVEGKLTTFYEHSSGVVCLHITMSYVCFVSYFIPNRPLLLAGARNGEKKSLREEEGRLRKKERARTGQFPLSGGMVCNFQLFHSTEHSEIWGPTKFQFALRKSAVFPESTSVRNSFGSDSNFLAVNLDLESQPNTP